MGEPVNIRYLAEQMIRFYGLMPEKDISIEYIGLRQGERLDEKLWWDSEIPEITDFERILKVKDDVNHSENIKDLDIESIMNELKPICKLDPKQSDKYRNSRLLRDILKKYIPCYALSEISCSKNTMEETVLVSRSYR